MLLFMLQLCSQAVVHSRCSLPAALGAVLASLWLPRGKDAVEPEAPAWGSVVLVTLMWQRVTWQSHTGVCPTILCPSSEAGVS